MKLHSSAVGNDYVAWGAQWLGSLNTNSCRWYSVMKLTTARTGKDDGVIVGGFS
jgi:hypothetical protein